MKFAEPSVLLSLAHYPWCLFIKDNFGQTSGHLGGNSHPNKPHDDQQRSYGRSGSTSDQSQKWNAGVLLIFWAPSLTTGAAPKNSCCNFLPGQELRQRKAEHTVFYLGLGQSLGQGKETSGTQWVCIYFHLLLPTMFLFCSFLDDRISFLSFLLSFSFSRLSSHMCLGSFYLLIS